MQKQKQQKQQKQQQQQQQQQQGATTGTEAAAGAAARNIKQLKVRIRRNYSRESRGRSSILIESNEKKNEIATVANSQTCLKVNDVYWQRVKPEMTM